MYMYMYCTCDTDVHVYSYNGEARQRGDADSTMASSKESVGNVSVGLINQSIEKWIPIALCVALRTTGLPSQMVFVVDKLGYIVVVLIPLQLTTSTCRANYRTRLVTYDDTSTVDVPDSPTCTVMAMPAQDWATLQITMTCHVHAPLQYHAGQGVVKLQLPHELRNGKRWRATKFCAPSTSGSAGARLAVDVGAHSTARASYLLFVLRSRHMRICSRRRPAAIFFLRKCNYVHGAGPQQCFTFKPYQSI